MSKVFFILLSCGLVVVYLQSIFTIKALERDNYMLNDTMEVYKRRLITCEQKVKDLQEEEFIPYADPPTIETQD